MPDGPATTVLHYLRRLVAGRGADETGDDELLARFRARRDETAFAELMRRHGPMVLGVCRRMLHDPNDADDAFQATFLVLVKRGGSLSVIHSVGDWLHGVAVRTALRARIEAAKRRQREREAAAMPASEVSDEFLWSDLRPVLDEEIQRLPARYRAPFVLCHLEGKTNEEAARFLGCPKGTVLSRLARARERLRDRLTKRGVTLSTATLAAVVTERTASAAMPPTLALTTLRAAVSLAATGTAAGIASTPVITLMEGVVHAMFMSKVRIALTVLLAVVLTGVAGVFGYHSLSAETPQEPKPRGEQTKDAKTKSERDDERIAAVELQRKLAPLMQKRLEAAKDQVRSRMEELIAGKTTVDVLLDASVRLAKAQQEMTDKKADQFKILESQLQRMKIVAHVLHARFDAGKANVSEVAQADYYRYDAEILLERFKAKHGGKAPEGEITKALFEGIDVGTFEDIGK
jgi:RNA polymerase sigma factor (sigma-70 family)